MRPGCFVMARLREWWVEVLAWVGWLILVLVLVLIVVALVRTIWWVL